MFNKLYAALFCIITASANLLVADMQYNIQDIDTLQTRTSEAIALNNQGQILGWYNIDGSNTGKCLFIRNKEGVFYELPVKEPASGLAINWQYLTDEGKVYGIFDVNLATKALCVWDKKNGVVKLGILPGKEISAINNAGQVLIKSVGETESGKSIRRPVIWENGKITKLYGAFGDLGIESEESYGFDMNNKGEVVGQSLVCLSYKNNLYMQTHATKWENDKVVDFHANIGKKTTVSGAYLINDKGDVYINDKDNVNINGTYSCIIKANGGVISVPNDITKMNSNYLYNNRYVFNTNGVMVMNLHALNAKLENDFNSIWLKIDRIIDVNDDGEILAQGKTIWGEQHTVFLAPEKSN